MFVDIGEASFQNQSYGSNFLPYISDTNVVARKRKK